MDKQSILGSRNVHVNYSYRETGPGNARTPDFEAHDTFDDGEHYVGDRRCKRTNNGRKTKSYNTKRYKPYDYFVEHYDRWGRQTLYYNH